MKWESYRTLLKDLKAAQVRSIAYIPGFREVGHLSVQLHSNLDYQVQLLHEPTPEMLIQFQNSGAQFDFQLPKRARWKNWVWSPAFQRWLGCAKFYLLLQFLAWLTLLTLETPAWAQGEESSIPSAPAAACRAAPSEALKRDLILPPLTLNAIQRVLEFEKNPEILEKLGVRPQKGWLFVGPPGTGKTLAAQCLAKATQRKFIHIGGSELTDKMFIGSGAHRIREVFQEARKCAPAILFIDELDSVGINRTRLRDGIERQAINELLNQLDGVHPLEGVTLIAATNRLEDLDEALLRPGRFDSIVHFELPGLEERMQLLQLALKRIKLPQAEIDLHKLAEISNGKSGADIQKWVQNAAKLAFRSQLGSLTSMHLIQVFFRNELGLSKGPSSQPERLKSTAFHEAGHLLLGWLLLEGVSTSPSTYVTLEENESFQSLGMTYLSALHQEGHLFLTEAYLRNIICVKYGGRTAEVHLHGPEGKNFGASSDLSGAFAIAQLIIASGFLENSPCVPELMTADTALSPFFYSKSNSSWIHCKLNQILREEETRALRLLKKNARAHRALAVKLLEKTTLFHEDLVEFFKQYPVVGEPQDRSTPLNRLNDC